jgi:membrane-bound lytic murein transglycosylase MltF
LKLNTTTRALACLLVALFLVGCSEDISESTKVVVANPKEVSQQSQEGQASDNPAFDLRMQLELAPAELSQPLTQNQNLDASPPSDSLLERAQRSVFGDLDSIRKRRFLRVLVTYSRTNFFFHQGMPRGFEYDLMMEYEKHLNRGIDSPDQKVKLVFIPVRFDRLLDDLNAGRGDIAAAGLTVTPERSRSVEFADPYIKNVDEVMVGRSNGEALTSLLDLSAKQVVVRKGSSYVSHLRSVNRFLEGKSLPAVQIIEATKELATEDILELVHSGVVDLTVADKHIAQTWSKLLPDIKVHSDVAINTDGKIAWAVRPDSPKLLASLNKFVKENRKGSLLGNILFTRYYKKNRWITNPLSQADRQRLKELRRLFERYGAKYHIDWLKLVAQGYQESRLNQAMRSSAGAVGILQLLPSTAADKNVGIANIETLENNVHAGAKYMAFLRHRYFDKEEISAAARMDFAWASYNAGPNRIRRLRKLSAERGFDPNIWFGNVEVLAAEKIGRETVDYVRNINKYFIAYKLYFESRLESDPAS